MVDHFDPNGLRLDLLRRIAQSQSQPQPTPSWLSKCAEELQLWFQETALGRLLGQKSGEADVREERDLQGLTTGDRMKRRAFPAKALGAGRRRYRARSLSI
eukprot:g25887.t1